MKTEMNKQEFIELCEAVENNIISLDEFTILSNVKSFDKVHKILKIMKMEDVIDRKQIFKTLIDLPGDGVHKIYLIFQNMPIYRSDKERQEYLFEHIDYPSLEILSRILQYDCYFQDKKFLEQIEEVKNKRYFSGNVAKLANVIRNNNEHYQDKKVQDLSKRTLIEIKNKLQYDDFLQIMYLGEVVNEPLWIEYLIKICNEKPKETYFYEPTVNYCDTLNRLVQMNRFDHTTKALKELDEQIQDKNEKLVVFKQFMNKLHALDEKEMDKDCEKYFDYLLEKAKDRSITDFDFNDIRAIIDSAIDNNLSLEEVVKINEITETVKKTEYEDEFVRDLVLETIRNQKSLINDEILQILPSSSYDEARVILTKEAIKQNDKQYIESSKEYHGEIFSSTFIDYLSKTAFTKEELLALKNRILTLDSNFDEKEKIFIIDTASIVEETDEKRKEETSASDLSLQEPMIYEQEENVLEKAKRLCKKIFSK